MRQASGSSGTCLAPQNDARHRVLQHKRPRRGERARHEDDDGDLDAQLSRFRASPTYLRIPASSVAALCGLHPFQDLPQLLFDYVYQSRMGQVLLRKDAELLGLTLVDAKAHEREEMRSSAAAASAATAQLVEQVLEVSDGTRTLHSVDDVRALQRQIRAQAAKAREDGKLSRRQAEALVEAARGHVSTGFGTSHEDAALDAYEARTGCSVRERNEALLEWRFQRVHDVDGELGVTAAPLGEATRRVRGDGARESPREGAPATGAAEPKDGSASKPIEIDGIENEDVNSSSNNKDAVRTTREKAAKKADPPPSSTTPPETKPFFRIVGAVDGIRDELYLDSPTCSDPDPDAVAVAPNPSHGEGDFSDGEEDRWSLRPIVVECKHRMSEAKVPPPLYDQIQTCVYCRMYGARDADLIQVVRRRGTRGKDGGGDAAAAGAPRDGQEIDITTTRVSLHDPVHEHERHWRATLLPRLASFVDAVYEVRRDDGKRYGLLLAMVASQEEESDAAAWEALFRECPWLRHCDTAFGRRKR